MRVVLTTLNAKYIHTALALRYLRAFVQSDFPDTHICEYTIKDIPSRIVADLYARKPDVIGFSVYIWNVQETLPLIGMLKKVLPQTRIILGGPEVSYDTRYWMERIPEVDCIVQGEGEASFLNVLKAIESGSPFHQVDGVAYRTEKGICINPATAKIDLHQIPSPYGDEDDLASLRHRVVYYETSRGCPFSCQFCLSSIESGVRYFPLERVKADVLRLIRAGIQTIKFVDRTFNLKRDYAVELFQFLIDNQGETVFQFEITGDILHRETVQFLKQNVPQGLFRFEIGVQSTNDVTNSLVKRRQNFERLKHNILELKEAGTIVQHLDLIAGLPEEDYVSFRKTFDDVFALHPDELQLGFLKMLRGTGLRLTAHKFGYIYMDNPPYEVFANHVLSYDDVLRIKQVEDVLEKYWNEGRLRHTTAYLTQYVYESPFDLFQQFGAYWESQGWHRIGHQLEDLFYHLDEFLQVMAKTQPYREAARSYMIYDFLLQHRIRPHKVWWDRVLNRSVRAKTARQIAANPQIFGPEFKQLGLNIEDMEKHAVIELLPQYINVNLVGHAPQATPGLMLAYYPPGLQKGGRPQVFTAPIPVGDASTDLAALLRPFLTT
ncbi:B12-binding domain-containing radical SAM protein [Alicyclobacillus mengziensis]|uniref:B12-binding domain-containing radical SAM protein n=1 Tax=Alicyclobacillus mengziensis TaxID=2931921 RepID=A0A9X7VZB7_9BACL|nr:B12-binding domain-containing radical SAM protein [Alicyclobacillus mengziensis]QSO46478.1 B12-binding domain-containing radical SAM protein [Alicyclobacillus mengziensis]